MIKRILTGLAIISTVLGLLCYRISGDLLITLFSTAALDEYMVMAGRIAARAEPVSKQKLQSVPQSRAAGCLARALARRGTS